MDLQNKTFCVFGLRGTGKSTLVHHIAQAFGPKALVFDTLGEAPAGVTYDTVVPTPRSALVELDIVVKMILSGGPYRLLIIDEANRYFPPKPAPLLPSMAELNDQCRHIGHGVSIGYIARRLVQLNQDLTELADYIFVFQLKGRSDIKYLGDLSEGLDQAVLSLKPYHFVIVYPNRDFAVFAPIRPDEKWLARAKRLTK